MGNTSGQINEISVCILSSCWKRRSQKPLSYVIQNVWWKSSSGIDSGNDLEIQRRSHEIHACVAVWIQKCPARTCRGKWISYERLKCFDVLSSWVLSKGKIRYQIKLGLNSSSNALKKKQKRILRMIYCMLLSKKLAIKYNRFFLCSRLLKKCRNNWMSL